MTTLDDSAQPMLPGLTWSVVDSPASHTALPESVAQAVMSAISGEKCGESFAMLGPDGSWLKMYQGYYQVRMDGTSEEFSGTWPRSGTMRAGSCYPLPPLALRTEENGCLLWPTPTANDAKNATCPQSQKNRDSIPGALIRAGQAGPVNPTWVEWLMGFPLGWTGLSVSEML